MEKWLFKPVPANNKNTKVIDLRLILKKVCALPQCYFTDISHLPPKRPQGIIIMLVRLFHIRLNTLFIIGKARIPKARLREDRQFMASINIMARRLLNTYHNYRDYDILSIFSCCHLFPFTGVRIASLRDCQPPPRGWFDGSHRDEGGTESRRAE